MQRPTSIYLASASPRRRELLRQLGVQFQIVSSPVNEDPLPAEAATDYVLRLAAAKARAGWEHLPPQRRAPVLGADTTVVLDGDLLGKPADLRQAVDMLTRLSGRTHEVLTGIALRTAGAVRTRLSRSEVTFGRIDAAQARAYWESGEPRDKAGGYAIQGLGARFVQHLSGSFSGVMGLPLYETAQLLEQAGVAAWDESAPARRAT
ncbi:MAG: septum formation inhibitor Maf [Proteobacteria bacterium]|nr:septum formation inhibitor Maf [Pseudomonadota bacterium]